jgi:hypothetical protein
MKFCIDENIDFSIANKLKQYGHEICIAKRGTDDGSIWYYVRLEQDEQRSREIRLRYHQALALQPYQCLARIRA